MRLTTTKILRILLVFFNLLFLNISNQLCAQEKSLMQQLQQLEIERLSQEGKNIDATPPAYLGTDTDEGIIEYKTNIDVKAFLANVKKDITKAKQAASKKMYKNAIAILSDVYDRLYKNRNDIEYTLGAKNFNPNSLKLLTSQWYFKIDDLESASSDLDDFLNYIGSTTSKTEKSITLYKANLYYKMQRFEDAILAYTDLLQNYKINDSLMFYCYFYRGISRYNIEDNQLAYEDFGKCASIYPTKFEPKFNMGRCLFRRLVTVGDLKKAITHFTDALTINPLHIPSLFLRARSYERLKKYKDALKDFERCTMLDKTYADAFYKKALMKYRLNRNKVRKSICAQFQEAVRLGSGNALIFINENCKK